MKHKTLKALPWFSFTPRMEEVYKLTIFQAIAYALRKETELKAIMEEYVRSMNLLEDESAYDIYLENEESSDHIVAITDPDDIDYQEVRMQKDEVAENLSLLNDNRLTLIEHIGAPISIIYSLLQSEINSFELEQPTSIKITKKNIHGIDYYYFNESDLENWKTLSTVKGMGLLDANIDPERKSRGNKKINREKITGMLIYLLAMQSLYVSKEDKDQFFHGTDFSDISPKDIHKYFKKHHLDEDYESISELRSFPRDRTAEDFLEDSYQTFNKYVDLK